MKKDLVVAGIGALIPIFIGVIWNGWQSPSKADFSEFRTEMRLEAQRINDVILRHERDLGRLEGGRN
jgi:hypothetical protein